MTRILASGADSAAALAKSRTIEALVLNKSAEQLVVNYDVTLANGIHTVACHSRLARDASRDEHNLSPVEGLSEAFGGRAIAGNLDIHQLWWVRIPSI
jgi:hypothetical protein